MKLFQRISALLLCAALLSPAHAHAGEAQTYPDVPAGHWAEQAIYRARETGLMQGVEGGLFGLGRTFRRAEFVTVLSRMFSWSETGEGQSFSDVTADKWYFSAVEQAVAAGVAEPSGVFRPEEPITRREMAQMLVAALGYGQIAAAELDTPFADVSGPGSGALALAYDMGMVTGVQSSGQLLFLPEHSATREEAAAMLTRVYDRYETGIQWLHGFYAFSSYPQIDLTTEMDGVSVGWARLALDEEGTPWINDTYADGNEWVKPVGHTAATEVFTKNNTLVNLNIFCSDPNVFLKEDARETTVSAIVAASVDYAGITMDVEGPAMRDEGVKQPYSDFMAALRAALPEDKLLYVCVPPDTWYHGYDYAALGRVCDKVILMAHDYQWASVPADYVGTDKTENPVTPIADVYETLRSITDPVTGVADRSKIALQISFAHVGLKVDENGLLLERTLYTPAAETVYRRLCQPDSRLGWSEEYLNPWLDYTTEDGSHYRLWYEDARSVDAKLRLARMLGIHSVSLWRLGNIPNYDGEDLYYNVWDTLMAQMEREREE